MEPFIKLPPQQWGFNLGDSMSIPKKDLMSANHKKKCEGGRKKRGYYLTDQENERVKAFINELKAAK